MWTEEPDFPELLDDQNLAVASIGTVKLPAPSHPAKFVLLGRKPTRPASDAPQAGGAKAAKVAEPPSYYLRLVFHVGPRVRVSEYVDVDGPGTLGVVKSLSGVLAEGLLPGAPPHKPRVFFDGQLIAILDPLKASITEPGPKGEKLLAREAEVQVPREAYVHVRYDLTTTAEEASEDFGRAPCPPCIGNERPRG